MTVSEARAHLPELLDRVEAGHEVTITRHGKRVAVVVRPDRLRTRRADRALAAAESVGKLLERGRTTDLAEAPAVRSERVDELVEHVRAGRAGRER